MLTLDERLAWCLRLEHAAVTEQESRRYRAEYAGLLVGSGRLRPLDSELGVASVDVRQAYERGLEDGRILNRLEEL